MIYSLIIMVIFTLNYAKYDAEKVLRHDFIDSHTSRFLIRALVCIIIGKGQLLLSIQNAVIVFVLFDYAFNFYSKRPILSLGTTAHWDKFWTGKEYLLLTLRILSLSIFFI